MKVILILILFFFSFLSISQNLSWVDIVDYKNPNTDSIAAITRNSSKPVIIYFTGRACVNNRKFEQSLEYNQDFINAIDNRFTIIELFVDDNTLLPEKEWIEDTTYVKFNEAELPRMLKTIGGLNYFYQKTQYATNFQPFLVIKNNNDEIILADSFLYAYNFELTLKEYARKGKL